METFRRHTLEHEQPPIVIKRPTLDDVPKYRRVQAEEWLKVYPNEDAGVSRDWVKSYVDSWMTEEALALSRERVRSILQDNMHSFLFVAKEADEVIGMVSATERDGVQRLEAIYVDSEYHGKGVGKQLLDRACDSFDPSVPTYVDVALYNDRAIRFYEKNGFVLVPGSEHLFAETIPSVHMVRQLEDDESNKV